ncbi:MAG: sigma-70 family RNA polymerase sigma factor [Candidatus Marinimicrobia bacterium]|nr:sigma-70 family RNA polymerase sigma factor [Candidatus Neomarinimicrobiota bacterium]
MQQPTSKRLEVIPHGSKGERNQTVPINIVGYRKSTYAREDNEERKHLIFQHLGLVSLLAKRFKGRGIAYEDLVQVGIVGLIKAIENFNPNNGTKLATFATHYIVGEIKHNFRDNGWYLKVPRKMKDSRNQVLNEVEFLTNSLQRSPTISEIAKHIVRSEEEVIEIIELNEAYAPSSLDGPISREKNDGSFSVMDVLAGENFEDALIDNISLDFAKKVLTNRERTIVVLYFEYDMSQSEIAQELRISQGHISRLLRLSLKKMREFMLSDKPEAASRMHNETRRTNSHNYG